LSNQFRSFLLDSRLRGNDEVLKATTTVKKPDLRSENAASPRDTCASSY
jgi:hypothetical protein